MAQLTSFFLRSPLIAWQVCALYCDPYLICRKSIETDVGLHSCAHKLLIGIHGQENNFVYCISYPFSPLLEMLIFPLGQQGDIWPTTAAAPATRVEPPSICCCNCGCRAPAVTRWSNGCHVITDHLRRYQCDVFLFSCSFTCSSSYMLVLH